MLVGGAVLCLPVVGFMLNMGCRLQMVHRMQRGLSPWPCWQNWSTLLTQGALATAAIVLYHIPALIALAVALLGGGWSWVWRAFLLGAGGTFLLPGLMTFYAHDRKVAHLLRPDRALKRVILGGPLYLKAWAIGIAACLLSFTGLLFFGIGFAWTSVWFWQVAAFCFSRVFSHQYQLLEPSYITSTGARTCLKNSMASSNTE